MPKAIIFFIVAGATAGFFVFRQITHPDPPGIISIGQQAPDFALKDEHNRVVKLSDYRGRLVFLHFWASWCPPCMDEAKDLEALNTAMKDKPFQILEVSLDMEWNDIHKFDETYNVTIPSLLDPGKQIARGLYKITGQPETFLIRADGTVLKHIIGPAPWSNPRLIAALESMLSPR
jgi:peroxiredoxin